MNGPPSWWRGGAPPGPPAPQAPPACDPTSGAPTGGGERRTGLQYIEPSIDHGRRTISLPNELDEDNGAFGLAPFQVWNQACRLLYLQLAIARTATGGPFVLHIWDLDADDPNPVQGDIPLIVVPGIPAGNIAYFAEGLERLPSGLPFDRGCRVYVRRSIQWVTDEDAPPLSCIRARVKVERCVNERCPTCMD